jgi:hypothetical protein
VARYVAYFDGEKDPRNLMIVFSILQVAMVEWDVSADASVLAQQLLLCKASLAYSVTRTFSMQSSTTFPSLSAHLPGTHLELQLKT